MDSLLISGDTLAAEDNSGLAGDPVLDVLLFLSPPPRGDWI